MKSTNAIIRLANFMALYEHALRHREMNSFNRKEIGYARALIEAHAYMDVHEYVRMLNRLTIYDEDVRQAKRTQLWGCLLEAATAEVPKTRMRKELSNQNLEGKLKK